MNPRIAAFFGIIGAVLFIGTSIIGGFLMDGYSHISQFISEAYAVGTPYGLYLRIFGYLPSGILLAMFGFWAYRYFKQSLFLKWGFGGFAVFYGIGMIIVSIFPCDAGCTIEMLDSSFPQIIHNFFSVATYMMVPWCLVATGLGFKKRQMNHLAQWSMVLGLVSCGFVLVFLSCPTSAFVGLLQRIIESCILGWVFMIAFYFLKR